jgi:hypothetical protein
VAVSAAVTPGNTRFVKRETDAYTLYLDDLPVAVIVKIHEGQWLGITTSTSETVEGTTRGSVAHTIVEWLS